MITNTGQSVLEISNDHKVLLIFLRHLGCMFCREALKDIKNILPDLEKLKTEVVLIHMADSVTAEEVFEKYQLPSIKHISDIKKDFYQAFGLTKGDFRQLFGFKSFIGMGRAAVKGNFPASNLVGDPHQMPGVFVVDKAEVSNYYLYSTVGDYPNYISLVKKSASE